MARSFHYKSALRDTRNQRGFVGCSSTVATTTFSTILADFLLYTSLSQVEVLASHLALEQVLCKHTSGGCDFRTFCSVFYPSICPIYPHRINTEASAKALGVNLYKRNLSTHQHARQIQTLSPLSRSAKTPRGCARQTSQLRVPQFLAAMPPT